LLTVGRGSFQSSSGPREPDVPGRNRRQKDDTGLSILVRPSRAGRPKYAARTARLRPLSILVRPSRAGRPPRADCQCDQLHPFNPRPALASRTSTARPGCTRGPGLSILVRPSRAGRPGGDKFLAVRDTGFQSSSGPREPDVPLALIKASLVFFFQSSSGPREPDVR